MRWNTTIGHCLTVRSSASANVVAGLGALVAAHAGNLTAEEVGRRSGVALLFAPVLTSLQTTKTVRRDPRDLRYIRVRMTGQFR